MRKTIRYIIEQSLTRNKWEPTGDETELLKSARSKLTNIAKIRPGSLRIVRVTTHFETVKDNEVK